MEEIYEMPNRNTVGAALQYLGESDKTFAHLFAAKDAHKEKIKLLKAQKFLQCDKKMTAAERNAFADGHDEVKAAIEDYENMLADYKLIELRRRKAELVIEVWRTVEASQRRGQV